MVKPTIVRFKVLYNGLKLIIYAIYVGDRGKSCLYLFSAIPLLRSIGCLSLRVMLISPNLCALKMSEKTRHMRNP